MIPPRFESRISLRSSGLPTSALEPLTRSSRVRTGTAMTGKKIVFQGEPGANSHLASREVYPDYEAVPSATFEDAFAATSAGEAALGMIPIENPDARAVR